jgi:RNA polymerase sigma factor (sigma-70 family)
MATAPPRPDTGLVRRLRERDRTAWEELYAAYGPRLRGYALRLAGNPHDADDLVQETFVRALPRLDRLDPETVELAPYLFTTLRNTFLKGVERSGRATPVEEVPEPEEPQPIEDDPERGTLLRRQQEEVRVANARLAPRQRLVLALRELEDRSYAEIGAVVGLNENAVAQLISRARESLRTELRLAQVDPQRLPEECREFLPLLSRHLDGHLKGEPLERTLAHLEGCERCQDALASMREASRRYRTLFPPLAGGEEAHAATIDLELTAGGYWEPRRFRLLRRSRRAGALAAAAVVAGLAAAGAGVAVLAAAGEPEPVDALAAPTTTEARTSATTTQSAGPPAPPSPEASEEAASTAETQPAPAPEAATTTTARPRTETRARRTATTVPRPRANTRAATTTRRSTTTAPRAATRTRPSPTTMPTVTADTRPPRVTITGRPPAVTHETAASFTFRADEAQVTFACRLDGAPYTACTSPRRYQGLEAGIHVFAVRARDRAGNVGPAVTAQWEIVPPDTTPPTVTITSAATSGGEASFAFTASEPGVDFACSLDGGAFEPCTSPKAYTGLAPGTHTFAVRGTDPAGNTGVAAEHAWTVPRPLPDLVISSLTIRSFTVTNIGTAPADAFVVSVTLVGVFTFAGLAPGESATRTWSPCRRGTITAVADRGNRVEESDETNNVRSIVSTC